MKILMAFQSQQKSMCKLFRKYLQGFQSSIIACCLQRLELQKVRHFQKATHACAFCFCLGTSRLFTSDTSPKAIAEKAWENAVKGLGKIIYIRALARAERMQRSTMGKKIC